MKNILVIRTKLLIRTLIKHIIVLIASTNMENIRDIKKRLSEEDYGNLSKVTGYSTEYIKNCVQCRRNNRLIVMAAQQVLATTQHL